MRTHPLGKKKCITLDERPYIVRIKGGRITSGEMAFKLELEEACRKAEAKYER